MKLLYIASIVLYLSSFTETAPTHIIKFKRAMDESYAHALLSSSHQAYLQSAGQVLSRKKRDLFPAEQSQWELESIRIGKSFMAMAGNFTDASFMDYLSVKNDIVDYVELNQYYQADMVLPTHDRRGLMSPSADSHPLNVHSMKPANWGLARINHRSNANLSTYNYNEDDGHGVNVYVLDSGVYADHVDFDGRASTEISFVSDEPEDDQGGHGTHVAGKIGGKKYGVAKGVNIHAVKILNKSGIGTTGGLIQALSHVIEIATPGKSLINLSLSGPKSKILNEVLSEVAENNIPIFVSAGNSGSDACHFSPSSSKHVFVVGATDQNDHVPNYSDVGECVSLYAPGSNIESTWIGSKEATQSLDGTSMSNPHVSGIAAILMSKHTYDSVHDLYDALRSLGTRDVLTFNPEKLTDINNHNLLAYYNAQD